MAVFDRSFPISLICFGSPVYWPDRAEAEAAVAGVTNLVRQALADELFCALEPRLIDSEAAMLAWLAEPRARREGLSLFVPLSGGVQPWMCHVAEAVDHVALLHVYLEAGEGAHHDLPGRLMHRNAHPASTDFYAWMRQHKRSVHWIGKFTEAAEVVTAWQGVQRLRHARLLKIGETEPWVINSCRDPQRIADAVGTTIIPIELETLLDAARSVSDVEVRDLAAGWGGAADAMVNVAPRDISQACHVYAAMRQLLNEHDADGLSIACFAMIKALDTTSCLAVSTLNDASQSLGACEGDLDAALTMTLLKALGADFVWIANPIIRPGGVVDLVHCTAPRCACGQQLSYRLMRHHESGRGVAPEVDLPDRQRVTLTRIGADVTRLAVHGGVSERLNKLPACHTQLRVYLDDGRAFLDHLLGTHQVTSYGDFRRPLALAARFAGLDYLTDSTMALPES